MSIGGVTRGSAKTNGNPDAWLAVPKGVCLKIVGSSLTPGKTPAKK
ncbi:MULTISPECIES: BufA1 family periplasmic bufferin-type metallophore [Acidithiobacillus]